MTTAINANNTLNTILRPRVCPYVWDVIGYSGGLVAIFYYNRTGIIVYACSFVLYGLLNMFFDVCVVSFEYSNNVMPDYNSIGNYNFYIANKRYTLKYKQQSNGNSFGTVDVDDSKLTIDLSIYVGNYYMIEYILFVIYFFGITKRNYTMKNSNNFKDIEFKYV